MSPLARPRPHGLLKLLELRRMLRGGILGAVPFPLSTIVERRSPAGDRMRFAAGVLSAESVGS